MNVGELTNDQLKRAVTSRLRTGELDLLLREVARRSLVIGIDYQTSSSDSDDVPLRLNLSFEDLPVSSGH